MTTELKRRGFLAGVVAGLAGLGWKGAGGATVPVRTHELRAGGGSLATSWLEGAAFDAWLRRNVGGGYQPILASIAVELVAIDGGKDRTVQCRLGYGIRAGWGWAGGLFIASGSPDFALLKVSGLSRTGGGRNLPDWWVTALVNSHGRKDEWRGSEIRFDRSSAYEGAATSPAGGIIVGGRFYPGGSFIPGGIITP